MSFLVKKWTQAFAQQNMILSVFWTNSLSFITILFVVNKSYQQKSCICWSYTYRNPKTKKHMHTIKHRFYNLSSVIAGHCLQLCHINADLGRKRPLCFITKANNGYY